MAAEQRRVFEINGSLSGTLHDNRPATGTVYLSITFTSDTGTASSPPGEAQCQASSPNMKYATNGFGPYHAHNRLATSAPPATGDVARREIAVDAAEDGAQRTREVSRATADAPAVAAAAGVMANTEQQLSFNSLHSCEGAAAARNEGEDDHGGGGHGAARSESHCS